MPTFDPGKERPRDPVNPVEVPAAISKKARKEKAVEDVSLALSIPDVNGEGADDHEMYVVPDGKKLLVSELFASIHGHSKSPVKGKILLSFVGKAKASAAAVQTSKPESHPNTFMYKFSDDLDLALRFSQGEKVVVSVKVSADFESKGAAPLDLGIKGWLVNM